MFKKKTKRKQGTHRNVGRVESDKEKAFQELGKSILAGNIMGGGPGDEEDGKTPWVRKVEVSTHVVVVILVALLLLPVWLLGMSSVISFMRFMRQPVLYESVPMWVFITVIVLFLVYLYKQNRTPKRPPGFY